MHSKYTGVRADRAIIPYVVSKYLTPALGKSSMFSMTARGNCSQAMTGRLNPTVAAEVDLCFQREMPPCNEWTEVHLSSTLLRIIAMVSGSIFVGPEKGRDESYVDTAINYTLEVSAAADACAKLPPHERPIKAMDLPEIKSLHKRKAKTMEFIRPLIEARKKAIASDSDFQKPDDLVQWVLDGGQEKFGEQSMEELVEVQLGLAFAAIHTTSITTTNTLFTLASMPEVVPELREEIRSVLKEHGTFTSAALQQMKKLDSFLREVFRTYPLTFASFSRKVQKPFTLSTGQVIPKGVIIEVPGYAHSHDPDVYENPDAFDPWRSYRAREAASAGTHKASAAMANQLVTVSANNLGFGFGRHACPGRFFAANELKMIVGRALLDYDMALVGGATERYPNIDHNENVSLGPVACCRSRLAWSCMPRPWC